MGKSVRELELDQRKWRLFLIIGYRQNPEEFTDEGIFNHRLEEARLHLQYFDYQNRFPREEFPRMLMLGAGTGAEVLAAKELGYDAVGIGFLNQDQVEYAQSRGADMRVMDMHDLKFPNERFDVAFCNHSFEHCQQPWLVCAEVWASLRPGGRWWINLPTWQHSDKDGPSNEHFMILRPWYMRPMFRRCGFKELYFEDNEARYQFLLEKVPLDEIDPEFSGSGRRKKSMVDQLAKRLEIGREYE